MKPKRNLCRLKSLLLWVPSPQGTNFLVTRDQIPFPSHTSRCLISLDYNWECYPKLFFWKETVNENKQKDVSKYCFNLNLLLGDPAVSFVHFHLPGQVLLLYFNQLMEENWTKQGKAYTVLPIKALKIQSFFAAPLVAKLDLIWERLIILIYPIYAQNSHIFVNLIMMSYLKHCRKCYETYISFINFIN